MIDSDKVKTFEQKYKLGKELGSFKIEYEAKHVKYTSASCYRAELEDGSIRTCGNVILKIFIFQNEFIFLFLKKL